MTAHARPVAATVICCSAPVGRRRDAESQQLVACCATLADRLVHRASSRSPQRPTPHQQAAPHTGPAEDCHPQQALLPGGRLGVGGGGLQCGGARAEPWPAARGRRSAAVCRRHCLPEQRYRRRYVARREGRPRFEARRDGKHRYVTRRDGKHRYVARWDGKHRYVARWDGKHRYVARWDGKRRYVRRKDGRCRHVVRTEGKRRNMGRRYKKRTYAFCGGRKSRYATFTLAKRWRAPVARQNRPLGHAM